MAIHTLPLWEFVLDGIQIFLCGTILLFLIYNKIKYKRMTLDVPAKDNATAFADEIRIQSLKQQTEQAFDTILNVIHQERRTLQNYYDIEERKKDTHSSPLGCSERIKNMRRLDGKNRSKFKVMDNGKILMLSKKGLSVKEISRSVHRPRGEVELILRLNNMSVGDINSNTIRAQDRA